MQLPTLLCYYFLLGEKWASLLINKRPLSANQISSKSNPKHFSLYRYAEGGGKCVRPIFISGFSAWFISGPSWSLFSVIFRNVRNYSFAHIFSYPASWSCWWARLEGNEAALYEINFHTKSSDRHKHNNIPSSQTNLPFKLIFRTQTCTHLNKYLGYG